VFDIEGDWSATKLSATQTAPNLFPNGTPIGFGSITFMENTKSLASILGRAGVAVVPNVLLYATGTSCGTIRTIPGRKPVRHRAGDRTDHHDVGWG